jgi:catechol 2,3-dioxygenase-like lactoylglutathione lyase family enzyme
VLSFVRTRDAEDEEDPMSGDGATLARSDIAGRLPAQDLERARRFYSEKLGLEPVEERPGGLRYKGRSGEFALFQSAGAPSGDHTQLAFEVEDLDATVAELRRRGVVFEEYDLPGFTTVGGIADIAGNYPSKGSADRGAWFRDSEGNMIGLGQPVP